MQKHWIGKSYGVRIGFPYQLPSTVPGMVKIDLSGILWVFTTRADTLLGVTYVAISAEHPLALYAANSNSELAAFIKECRCGGVTEVELTTQDKKGMPTGLTVHHPITNESLPLWVANYVLMGYGEGAVMAVPAHDERDFAFARQFGLPIKPVIRTCASDEKPVVWRDIYSDHGVCINSGKYDGLDFDRAVDAITIDLTSKGLGEKKVTWRLRDWGISRQRYWGTPIPIVHCQQCGAIPVPDEQLPVVLPQHLIPDGSGNPLNKHNEFLNCVCPKCSNPAQRETDTMDTFVDSSWYFLRYSAPDADTILDKRVDYWMPVDQYIGGIEHAILHLLYARFCTKFIRDLGLVKFSEPFTNLLTQGMVLNHIFFRKGGKSGVSYYRPDDVKINHDVHGKIVSVIDVADGQSVEYGGIGTMSKSRKNGVDPQTLIQKFGADAVRLFIIFAAPPEQDLEWSDTGLSGAYRFLRRIWLYAVEHQDAIRTAGVLNTNNLIEPLKAVRHEMHNILRQALLDFNRCRFNTVIAGGMKILKALGKMEYRSEESNALRREGLSILLRLLSPIIPHITHKIWRELGYGKDILNAAWPKPDAAALEKELVTMVVQVNGKLRGKIEVPAGAEIETIKKAAQDAPNVNQFIQGRRVLKTIVVPGKLVNLVC
jgi:leucyl-tRNA synthetase